MKVAFYTLGCKVNQYESQAMGEVLERRGHTLISDHSVADVVIINSCTVTAESDRKTRQVVRRMRRLLPEGIIILCGCMPQAFPERAEELLAADIIVGNTNPEGIAEKLDEFIQRGERIIEIKPHTKREKYNTPAVTRFEERTRAFMKIEDGCDRYCTYCIIPKARGEIRSKTPKEIEDEAKRLAENGFCEIVLVGINLTSYGKDMELTICDAVSAAAKPEGIKRVRLGSLEPDHISDETLDALYNEPKFCPQFHLALQSGSDRTLKRMNRHYDTEFYRGLVKKIRSRFENASITTDIMVGFAGETEQEFSESVAFLKEIGFARSHVFAYSRRKGTVADGLKNQVEPDEKARRAAVMAEAARECEQRFIKSQIGLTAKVLFETYRKGINEGYTENYTRVQISGEDLSGKIVETKLNEQNLGINE